MAFDKKYIELATPSVSSRGRVIPLNELHKYLSNKTEVYRSLFILDDTAKEHFTKRKTIRSFKGKYMLDKILFDIDKKTDTGEYLCERVKSFIDDYLFTFDEDEIRIWFSGRGFHIEIPDIFGFEPSENLPYIVKQTIQSKFGKEVDNIYDSGRIIRVGYSYNNKSNCYKIPVKYDELDSLGYFKIKDLAKEGFREDYKFTNNNKELDKKWKKDIVSKVEIVKEKPPELVGIGTHVTCVQKMWNEGESRGTRHIRLLRIINAWKRAGIPNVVSRHGAKEYAKSLEASEIKRIVNSVYNWEHNGYSCEDSIMSEFCDSACRYYKQKNFGNNVSSMGEISQKFMSFVKEDFTLKSINLGDYYSSITEDYAFMPEEMVIVMGDTKLGKTAWVQNLCIEANHLNILYMTLEVGELLMYRRFSQIAHNMTKHECIEYHKTCDEEMLKEFKRPIHHIKMLQVSPELNEIKTMIQDLNTQVAIIDTIDGINLSYNNDPISKMDKVATSLKQIAQELGIIVVGISHISRSASREFLDIHSAKGNSSIEQKADKIIGITGDRDESEMRVIRALGSRDGNNFEARCRFDYNTFKFKEVI